MKRERELTGTYFYRGDDKFNIYLKELYFLIFSNQEIKISIGKNRFTAQNSI